MPCQMERSRGITIRAFYSAIRYVIAIMLLIVSTECTTVKFKDHWIRYYDPKNGTEIEDIQKHFNLHRGRWWNYYDRGSVFLTYGHHEKAHEDFAEAIKKRSRDKWDARTYGMHFIDYFPHRESGVTYYLEGERETNETKKEELFEKAIYSLEMSLSQEESSRAKFYLNQARRSLLQVTQKQDKIPPTIYVKKPIYTNRRSVQFDITVTDQDSYVKDIQIGSSCGDVRIDRPRLFVELAEKKVERTVELTVGPNDKFAVVTVTAADLAGNKSDPDKTLIIVDKQAPTAGFDIVSDNIQPDSPVEVSIEATDYFGLKQIQTGDDPNDKIDCDGAMQYSCNITGKPKAGKLAITVVDNAGNTVVTNILVDEGTVQERPVAHRPYSSRGPQFTKVGDLNRPLSPDYSPAPGFPMPRSSMPHHQMDYDGINSPAVFRASENRGRGGNGKTTFYLPPHVLQLGGKETSQKTFYVDGIIQNAENVKKITVNLQYEAEDQEKVQEKDIVISQTLLKKRNKIFSQKVDLSNARTDIPITITLEAYCGSDSEEVLSSCAKQIVEIIKREDCSREPDAIYGILLLPLRSYSTASELTDANVATLRQIYDIVLKSLEELRTRDQGSDQDPYRFNVYDLSEVGRASEIKEWYALKEKDYSSKISEIFRELQSRQTGMKTNESEPNVIDLVIDGYVKLSSVNGENRFEVTLRAIDVPTTKLIRFPGIGTEDRTGILADVYGNTAELKWYIEGLAFKVGERIPRLQANITDIERDKKIIEIDSGKRNRLFPQMKLYLYKRSDRNAVSENICSGKIISLDWYSCKIRPDGPVTDINVDDIAITK